MCVCVCKCVSWSNSNSVTLLYGLWLYDNKCYTLVYYCSLSISFISLNKFSTYLCNTNSLDIT